MAKPISGDRTSQLREDYRTPAHSGGKAVSKETTDWVNQETVHRVSKQPAVAYLPMLPPVAYEPEAKLGMTEAKGG